ncbi:Acetylcholine receptor subunit alpha [Holothuria leucospilota]|uniref:Acetylcholine receptor subunit alpha n=1 Tax=Holothuria leucospilota TaxID=206669 RepID=A0A9Q1BSM9_HOLLE|nr:Acetylcholine receptor subunit alpha [Holothuria leucospilota]
MKDYGSRAVRPRLKHTDPVRVALYFNPSILSSFDEQSQKLSVVGTMYMEWVDEYLMWDPDKYGGVTLISLRTEDIWMPDIAVAERLDVGTAVVNLFQPYLIVNNTGFVIFFQQTDLTIYCRLDMRKFPFDTQICEMRLLSYSYDSNQVILSFANTSASNENTFRKNGVWNLKDVAVEEVETLYTCCPFPYVEVHYQIILARIGSFYIFSIWIPCGLLSILELTVFLMHPNSGEKVTLSVNNVLAFILFQQIVVESMPRSGDDSPIIGEINYMHGLVKIKLISNKKHCFD